MIIKRRLSPLSAVQLERLLLVALLLVVPGCASKGHRASVNPDFMHRQFQARRAKITRVAIVESQADIVLLSYYGRKSFLSNETATIQARLPVLIETQLQKHGFIVERGVTETAERPGDTNQLSQARARVKEWMAAKPWRTDSFDAWDAKTDLGSAATVLATNTGSDALVFVKLWGKKNTRSRSDRENCVVALGVMVGLPLALPLGIIGGGRGFDAGMGLGMAIGGGTGWLLTGAGRFFGDMAEYGFLNAATLQVVVVDGSTGEILWATTRNGRFEGEKLEKLVARVFAEFPASKVPEPNGPSTREPSAKPDSAP
jgi:hypothetical protein